MNHRFFAMMPTDWAINPPPKAALQAWIVIWTHQDERNQCTATQDELMSLCGLSRSSVKNALAWLKADKKITTQSTGRGALIKVSWNSGTPSKKYSAQLGQKSSHQIAKKVTTRQPKKCLSDSQKSNHQGQADPLVVKDISEDISKELTRDTTKRAPARETVKQKTDKKIADGKLRQHVMEIAKRAWAEGEELPGTNPPRPQAINEKHTGRIKKLIKHLDGSEDWIAYGETDGRLLEYFRRCYFKPWNRQLTKSKDPWRPDRWVWFVEQWSKCVEWQFTSTQMREESQAWAFRLGRIGASEAMQRLETLLPD